VKAYIGTGSRTFSTRPEEAQQRPEPSKD